VRLETDNPGFALKPGMFVDVRFEIELPPSLAVPADAVVDSGLRKTVFVDRGNGFFEPRQVETGWRIGDQVEVVKGLMAGERIVISGTFLIDSESKMKAAAQRIVGAAAEDPVCGMRVDEKRAAAAGQKAEYRGKSYFFCADDCRLRFEQVPERYVKDAAPTARHEPSTATGAPAGGAPSSAKDPVCGMDVNVKEAAAAGRTSVHDGRTCYFCPDDCKQKFDADPARYAKKGRMQSHAQH
jgi:YHS domain-containing protein